MMSISECARPDDFRSTIETMNDPAVTDDAVARKRMREAIKTTSGDEDFWSDIK